MHNDTTEDFQKIRSILLQLRQAKPLILNLTNHVTMDFIANGLIAVGASPVMSCAHQELDDLLKIADVLVINLGTLNESFVTQCENACAIANKRAKPIILDPVGAGASVYRTATALHLLETYAIAIVRGNASEIRALADDAAESKGVDSLAQSLTTVKSAQSLAKKYHATILMSGAVDIVVDQELVHQSQDGSPMMPLVTGTGCLLSAIVGAIHAVQPHRFTACMAAARFYGRCGELAEQKSFGPGSFKVNFIDTLYRVASGGHDGK